MSLALQHSPATIIQYLLIGGGIGGDPTIVDGNGNPTQAWPVYSAGEPDKPDQVITVYDTQPISDGRDMPDGQQLYHYGLQFRIRAATHDAGFAKMDALVKYITETVYRQNVLVDSTWYFIQAIVRVTIAFKGKETPTSKRTISTVNALTVVKPVTV